jgi:hypothetical protein
MTVSSLWWPLKVSLVLLLLLSPGSDGGRSSVVLGESGTLLLIGFTRHAFVLAADSAVYSNGKIIRRNAVKMLPIGRFGAVLIQGAPRITGDAGKEIDLYGLVSRCAAESHNIEIAEMCVRDRVTSALPKRLRLEGASSDLIIGTYFAGYVHGKPAFYLLEFGVKNGIDSLSVNDQKVAPDPGFFEGYGRNDFARSVLSGKIPELSGRKEVQLWQARAKNHPVDYTVKEMEDLEKFLLIQTESPLARRYDPSAASVTPPNHFIVISQTAGLQEMIPAPKN